MQWYWFFLFVFLSPSACAHAPLWQIFFSLENTFPHAQGFSQIPQGGSVESSSRARPSFKEVGLHNRVYSVTGGTEYQGGAYVALQYQLLSLQGETILKEKLISHGQFIPAGRSFRMCVHEDWYRAEIGKKFYSFPWRVTPFFQANWIKYDYRFFSGPQISRRAFSLAGVTVGSDIQFYITKRFAYEAKATLTLPLSRLKMRTAHIGMRYDIPIIRLLVTPICGIGFTYIDYQDKQTLPNHVRYQGWPEIKVGFVVSSG